MTTIVVPLQDRRYDDGFSEAALPLARALAERSGAGLALISVIDVPREYTALSQLLGIGPDQERDDRVVAERSAYLVRTAQGLGVGPVAVTVRFGVAADEILAAVETLSAAEGSVDPVVVMSSHGRAGLSRHAVGSVAFGVVRRAAWPVVVLRPAATRGDGTDAVRAIPELRRVLLPLDGSPAGESALGASLSALGPPDLVVRLLHVVEPVAAELGEVATRYAGAARGWAEDYLGGLAVGLAERGYRVDRAVREGAPAEEIGAAAEGFGADLVAMATHGRGGVGRMVLGSVAERVLRSTPLPLMLVPPGVSADAVAGAASHRGGTSRGEPGRG